MNCKTSVIYLFYFTLSTISQSPKRLEIWTEINWQKAGGIHPFMVWTGAGVILSGAAAAAVVFVVYRKLTD